MTQDRRLTRREFCRDTAGAAVGLSALSARAGAPATDRLRLGFIACGGRARQLMRIFAGFDDVEIATLARPALTTVAQPKYQLGYQAGKMILDLIENRTPTREVLKPHLVVRESTKPRASQSPLVTESELEGSP